ncbi:MAG TPA: (deoxy)nucleoside triphosphate pyrophosphohydrolase [Bacteroidales bacterium]|nr:(deoxy)nucleoside triphosphate pyrophosphohydrolase [Bacteroidales bacterium]
MIVVTCALIRNDEEKVLMVRRGPDSDHPFKWEFPGGKIAVGESDEECIIREIKEELSMDIVIRERLPATEYDYGIKKIWLIPFVCDTLDDIPLLSEHIEYKWTSRDELLNADLCEADMIVAGNYLKDFYAEVEANQEVIVNEESEDPAVYSESELKTLVAATMGAKQAEWMALSAVENNDILKRLIDYSYSDDRKLASKSSWTLSKLYDSNPEVLSNYLPGIAERIDSVGNESVQRSFLRILSLSDLQRLGERLHGILADHCFRMIRSGFSAIAVKAYSMEIIYKLALFYPGLANELSAAIRIMEEEKLASGILARGRAILRKLAASSEHSGSIPT